LFKIEALSSTVFMANTLFSRLYLRSSTPAWGHQVLWSNRSKSG